MEYKLPNLRFLFDTNRINARGKLDCMKQLEELAKGQYFEMVTSEVVINELKNGFLPGYKKSIGTIYTLSFDEDENDPRWKKIESILFPKGTIDENEKNDVRIVFHALKYHYILITDDENSKSQPRGMIGNAEELKEALGVEIMKDCEALQLVRDNINLKT